MNDRRGPDPKTTLNRIIAALVFGSAMVFLFSWMGDTLRVMGGVASFYQDSHR